MPKFLLAALSLAGILTLAAVLTPSGRADPPLSRSNSELPPPRTIVLCRRGCGRPPFHPLGLRRLASFPRRG